MSRTAHTIDCHGQPGKLKFARIAVHAAAGRGIWHDGVFHFHRRAEPRACHHSPTLDIASAPYITDSGQLGFLRYPEPEHTCTGPKFLALSRMGAGL